MTDNEIIKALEICSSDAFNDSKERCTGCKYDGADKNLFCFEVLEKDALDLINRQKNEIISRTEEYNDMLEQRNKVEEALEVMTMDVNSLTSERDALNEIVAYQKAELSKKDTEIDILIRKKEALRDENSELKAENERLQKIIVGFMDEVGTWSNKYDVDISNIYKLPLLAKEDLNIRNKIITEAIKEFVRRLKWIYRNHSEFEQIYARYLWYEVDNLVKEMTE